MRDTDLRRAIWVADVPGGITVATKDVRFDRFPGLIGQLAEWDRLARPSASYDTPLLGLQTMDSKIYQGQVN